MYVKEIQISNYIYISYFQKKNITLTKFTAISISLFCKEIHYCFDIWTELDSWIDLGKINNN